MVAPTPSEKPTCEHGKLSGHYWITDADITSFGSWCPGPAIATPEKCKIEKESGFCDPHESYECSVIAPEPETPVSEATDCGEVSPVLEAFRESNDAAWKRYGVFLEMRRKMPEDEAYAYASRLPIRSDPSPELRERIARVVCDARMKCGWPDNERLPRGFIDATDEQIADAILEKFVLSALGEPK